MNNISDNINSVLKLYNDGKKEDALIKVSSLLNKNNNNNYDLLIIHAKISINLNYIEKANQSLSKILKYKPNNLEALELIYTNYLKINNYKLAKLYIDKLLLLKKPKYKLLRDKAFVEYLNKSLHTSLKYIQKALLINDQEVFGLNILGLIYIEMKEVSKAIPLFEKAITVNPKYADSYNNLGKCFIDLEKLDQAYLSFKKSYRVNPKSDLPLINIANILSLKDKNIFALHFYEKARQINPNNTAIDENIALCNFRLKNFDWAYNKFHDLKNLNSSSSEIILGYSYLLLSKKKFSQAFELFDVRLKIKNFPNKNLNHSNIIEKINSQKIFKKNSKILIVKEQGVGDEILFSSMYKDIINTNKNVSIECDHRLLEIFNRSFQKNIFYPFGYYSSSKSNINNFDNVLYAGSLTKFFRKNENNFKIKPYLKVLNSLDEKIKNKFIAFKGTKKIGISWKSVFNIYGSLKSLKINDFEKIFTKDRTLINLQYGDTDIEINQSIENGNNIYNFNEVDLFNDFDSLISILKNLDVFVTVSNSTAHFAGALGVPTILICPKKSSTYYYWDYEDGKTPWYESVSVIKIENSIDYTMNLVNDLINNIK